MSPVLDTVHCLHHHTIHCSTALPNVSTRNAVGLHNRRRCDDLNSEKKLGTNSWGKRFNLSIFDVSFVDTYNVYTQSLAYEDTSHVFFVALDE